MKILKKITVALFVFLILLTITTFQTVYAYQGPAYFTYNGVKLTDLKLIE